MSETFTKRDAIAHLVHQISESNVAARSWSQLYVTIQSGLAVGAGGAIAFWLNQFDKVGAPFGLIPVFLLVFAIRIGSSLTNVIVRAHRWQTWQVARLKDIQARDDAPLNIFPLKHGEVDLGKPGYVADQVASVHRALTALYSFGIVLLIGISIHLARA